jgi:hypothetical protein
VPDAQSEATPPEPRRISPWWLLVAAIATGAVLTAIADLIPGSSKLSAVDWLGATVGVAALVVTVGIYRLQERSGSEAHAELMDQLEAQNELLGEFAKRAVDKDEGPSTPDTLTEDQRTEIEDRFGKDSIAAAIDPARGRGVRGAARLVRLNDGRLISVYNRRGQTQVREIGEGALRRQGLRSPRGWRG